MTPWLLIPVKSLGTGKSRLAKVMSSQERRQLNEFFLRHIIQVAKDYSKEDRATIITECSGVALIAKSLGVPVIKQSSASGLNQAAGQGVIELRTNGADDILIVASDLPTIRASDLAEIAARAVGNRIVICPDKSRNGTNAIFLAAHTTLRFRFGPNSFARHCQEAEISGIVPAVYFNDRIAMDVDVPEDLLSWRGTSQWQMP
jgi:2-phospho-L-lactate/phosphoenolpyruvate guanylyltransferase